MSLEKPMILLLSVQEEEWDHTYKLTLDISGLRPDQRRSLNFRDVSYKDMIIFERKLISFSTGIKTG